MAPDIDMLSKAGFWPDTYYYRYARDSKSLVLPSMGEYHACQNQRLLVVNVEIQYVWIVHPQTLFALEQRKLWIIYALDGARGIQRVT